MDGQVRQLSEKYSSLLLCGRLLLLFIFLLISFSNCYLFINLEISKAIATSSVQERLATFNSRKSRELSLVSGSGSPEKAKKQGQRGIRSGERLRVSASQVHAVGECQSEQHPLQATTSRLVHGEQRVHQLARLSLERDTSGHAEAAVH